MFPSCNYKLNLAAKILLDPSSLQVLLNLGKGQHCLYFKTKFQTLSVVNVEKDFFCTKFYDLYLVSIRVEENHC